MNITQDSPTTRNAIRDLSHLVVKGQCQALVKSRGPCSSRPRPFRDIAARVDCVRQLCALPLSHRQAAASGSLHPGRRLPQTRRCPGNAREDQSGFPSGSPFTAAYLRKTFGIEMRYRYPASRSSFCSMSSSKTFVCGLSLIHI